MNIYTQKRRWKLALFLSAIIIVTASLYYSNIIVQKIARDERTNVQIWADAIHQKAHLVNYQEQFFERLQEEERKRVEIWAEAYKRILDASLTDDITFYSSIIEKNTTIPVILTNEKDSIIFARNVDFSLDEIKILKGKLKREFTVYPPIINSSYGNTSYLYYKDSRLFTELRNVLNNLIKTFFSEVVTNSASVPVIITDSTRKNIITFGNIDSTKIKSQKFREKTINAMADENMPIMIDLTDQGIRYIFYRDSSLLIQLRFYPYIQLAIISLFLLIAYVLFNTSRRSEQNQVWVGLAKETAHQLGTPLSSMMAWVELMKMEGKDNEVVKEIEKDVQRLETITERFSKIGSLTNLEEENLVKIIYNSVDYIKSRTSKNIKFIINQPENIIIIAPVNLNLFEWVIENLCKNAVDAMSGIGTIKLEINEDEKQVFIDVCDTGKGIPRSKFKTVFIPGYTSKKRGWGLGLSLSKRIIDNYHSGRIFVKSSTLNKGTTFRIILNKTR